MTEKKQEITIESTLKSQDTEEFIDLIFYRPIGFWWALLFNKFDIHPNTVTIYSIFLGVGAGILFYFPDLWYNIAGMLLLIWANMYDSADGQLARMTGKKSELGRILDGACGDIWFITIYAAICLRLTPEWSFYIWILGAVTGYFHSKQAAMADYFRNIHLYFLKGTAGSELGNSGVQKALYATLSWKKDFIRKLFTFFYINYTVSQEKFTPNFQRFFKAVKERYGDNVPVALREEFRAGSKPLMKYTNMLSFNTRVIVLFISLFVGMPWIYFCFELTVLNAMLWYMVTDHERKCKRLLEEVNSGEFDR